MRRRLAIIALAVALGTVAAAPRTLRSPRITETAARPVTIAALPCATSVQSTSSGYVIADELVVTVAHALYDSRDFVVRDASGRWHDAKVQHLNRETDLAVLRVRTLAASPVALRVAEPDERVRMFAGAASGTTVGSVLRRVRISTAIVGDLSQTSVRRGYELDVGVTGGDSGAAVVDDDDNLVGLIFAKSTTRDASWAVSAAEIESALNRRDIPSWTCGRESNAEIVLSAADGMARLHVDDVSIWLSLDQ